MLQVRFRRRLEGFGFPEVTGLVSKPVTPTLARSVLRRLKFCSSKGSGVSGSLVTARPLHSAAQHSKERRVPQGAHDAGPGEPGAAWSLRNRKHE